MVSRLTVLVLQQRPGIPQARPVGARWLRYRLSQYPDIPPLSALPAQSWRSLILNFQVVGALANGVIVIG